MASLGRENVHAMVVVSLMEGEWSHVKDIRCQCNGGIHGHVYSKWSLMEAEWLS